MIILFFINEVCLDTLWEYAVHCKELPNFKYNHDFVRDVFFMYSGGICEERDACELLV